MSARDHKTGDRVRVYNGPHSVFEMTIEHVSPAANGSPTRYWGVDESGKGHSAFANQCTPLDDAKVSAPEPSACRACLKAAYVLRRMGFKDNISWGFIPGSPNTDAVHGSHSNAKGTLCVAYRSELAWMSATRPQRVTVYMAAPVSGDFHQNVINATQMFRYLRHLSASDISGLTGVYYPSRPLILCPWLAGIEPDELSPGGREGVLQDSRDSAALFDEVWLMFRVTEGMSIEAQMAPVIRDLTHITLPPLAKPSRRAQLNLPARKNGKKT